MLPGTPGLNRSANPAAESAPPPLIPGHEILGFIGRGGYGEVWLGRDLTGALRAVKVVRRPAAGPAVGFDKEFRALKKFQDLSREHYGFVDILQVGVDEAEGFLFYTMELADSAEPRSSHRCSVISDQSPASATRATPGSSLKTDDCSLMTSYAAKTLASELQRRGHLPVAEGVRLGVALCEALEFLHSRRLVHRDI
jgi:serine/threonine protein kinase